MAIKKRFTYTKEEKIYTSDYLSLLQDYEDTGLTPEDIEELKKGKVVYIVSPDKEPKKEKKLGWKKGRSRIADEDRLILPKWFQEAVRQRRKNNRVSLDSLASAVRVSQSTMRLIEVQEEYPTKKSVVQAICAHLGMEWAWDKLRKEADHGTDV